jgi:hypothetical protein
LTDLSLKPVAKVGARLIAFVVIDLLLANNMNFELVSLKERKEILFN